MKPQESDFYLNQKLFPDEASFDEDEDSFSEDDSYCKYSDKINLRLKDYDYFKSKN